MRSIDPRSINRLLVLPAMAALVIVGLARTAGLTGWRAAGQDAPGAMVVVDAFPDLAGQGDFWPDCPGCDGEFRAGDALLASDQPLPALSVRFQIEGGATSAMSTTAMSEGRQQAVLELESPRAVTVTLLNPPDGWVVCPRTSEEIVVDTTDFDDEATARVEFAVASICRQWTGDVDADGTDTDDGDDVADDAGVASDVVDGDLDADERDTDDVIDDVADDVEHVDAALDVESVADAAVDNAVDVDTDAAVDDVTEEPAVQLDAADDEALEIDPAADATDTAPQSDATEDQSTAASADDTIVGSSIGGASDTGSVAGVVFEDLDGDGRLGEHEPGLPDVLVRLVGEEEVLTVTTDSAGAYSIAGLDGEVYDVIVVPPPALGPVFSDRFARLPLAGRDLRGVDFALQMASIGSDAPSVDALGNGSTVVPKAPERDYIDDMVSPRAADDGLVLPRTGLGGQSVPLLPAAALVAAVLGALGLAFERRLAHRLER